MEKVTGKNSNSQLIGDDNSGTVDSNSNTKLLSYKSILDIANNSNCKLSFENAKAKLTKNSNAEINWKNSALDVQGCSNSQIKGDVVTGNCDFQDNHNFKFDGGQAINCKFYKNSNSVVDMTEGGEITAQNNSNLKIGGNLQNLIVEGTSNHKIRSVSTLNRFHILDQNKDGLNGFFSWAKNYIKSESPVDCCNLRYDLDYVEKGRVAGNKYSAGDFNWEMSQTGKELRLNLDNNSIKVDNIQGKTVLLSTDNGKGGSRQKLEIQAPNPITVMDNGKTIIVNLCEVAGL